MALEWDENKRHINIDEHGVDFREAESFEWATAQTEVRYVAFGRIGGRLHQLVYTMRGDATRIISLRKANSREERYYAAAETGSHQPDA